MTLGLDTQCGMHRHLMSVWYAQASIVLHAVWYAQASIVLHTVWYAQAPDVLHWD